MISHQEKIWEVKLNDSFENRICEVQYGELLWVQTNIRGKNGGVLENTLKMANGKGRELSNMSDV